VSRPARATKSVESTANGAANLIYAAQRSLLNVANTAPPGGQRLPLPSAKKTMSGVINFYVNNLSSVFRRHL